MDGSTKETAPPVHHHAHGAPARAREPVPGMRRLFPAMHACCQVPMHAWFRCNLTYSSAGSLQAITDLIANLVVATNGCILLDRLVGCCGSEVSPVYFFCRTYVGQLPTYPMHRVVALCQPWIANILLGVKSCSVLINKFKRLDQMRSRRFKSLTS